MRRPNPYLSWLAPQFIGGFFTLTCVCLSLASCTPARRYEPILSSIQKHRAPQWFDDAKLGIFVHWGLYSIPAYAPTEGEIHTIDPNIRMSVNPYAEWYANTMKFDGSPTSEYHRKTYGPNFNYYDFVPIFNEEVRKWKPDEMAEVFAQAGAKYVVLTTKHHDGFTLWPSKVKHPAFPSEKINCTRDIVGDLTKAVRKQRMKMGLYHSGGIDWTFDNARLTGLARDMSVLEAAPYSDYLKAQYHELIENYKPSVLWNDITYPRKPDAIEIIACYYNYVPEGVVNNRWGIRFNDFTTPEYAKHDRIVRSKWESCRGIGFSFGYNRMETDDQMLSEDQLIDMFVDIVSKNGNLLLNIGPKTDGSISDLQTRRLKALGDWLKINGEAIYNTRPWLRAEASADPNVPVRFTSKKNTLYAILLDKPASPRITIKSLVVAKNATIKMLGAKGNLKWSQQADNLLVILPASLPCDYAWCLEIKPSPKK